ncbi:hypothetical protein BJV74DRAFT_793109 [Russula compacta]|nr:hypothetical protein BJV74DRAFT_793109 [Russula compacta]
MVKLQSHKKIVIQSDLKRQASMVAKQSVLPSRDPRTVCMTERDLGYLLDSFRANRWPERAEKERLAQLIGKSYEKVHHWFSNQRQKMANVEKALKPSRASQTPLRPSNGTVTPIGGTGATKVKDENCETLQRVQAQDVFMREDSSDVSDISVEDGARILLEFIASVRAAHGTPSP